VRLFWALVLVGGAALAKPTLRLSELPADAARAAELRRVQTVSLQESQRNESAILLLTMRAQQFAEPRGRLPSFVPALSTTCIGGSLRLDF
jgi:hypothetical protein